MTSSRGRPGLDQLLRAQYQGVIGSDRWTVYNRYQDQHRQRCWAHLTRNVRALAEGRMAERRWAEQVLTHIDARFGAWHRFRAGATTRAGRESALLPMQQALRTKLHDGQKRCWYKIVGLSNELLSHWEALWTFARVPGVEPTNNAAERALRGAVIWRKQCFGTQSEQGSRFVERILSVVATCRQQARNVWFFLSEAVAAERASQPAPTLLPTP